jgi:hypothetical protein
MVRPGLPHSTTIPARDKKAWQQWEVFRKYVQMSTVDISLNSYWDRCCVLSSPAPRTPER